MDKPQPLNATREQITNIDNTLLSLLAKRRELSLEVARSKEVDVRPVRDTQRERELLARLVQKGREQGLDPHFVLQLYQNIIEDSVLNQQAYLHGRANPETQKQQYCIAYLGARGSYSYLAANRYCNRRQVDMVDLGCQSFDEIVQSVESGHADYGFLPIENTSSGSINEVYDVLQHTSLAIVGETTIEVGHCLLAMPGTTLADIKTLYAHPQPISQCSRYLARHPGLKLEYCASSAEAMEKVQAAATSEVAAIGSAEGGALYQLDAIEKGLANQKINQSRFIVVARKAVAVPEQLPAKCTLIMATGQKPGALVEALLVLKNNQLNMSKLESRPIPGTPWEEMFYLDIDANLASAPMQLALKELERITRFIKVLGCYPCETVAPTQLTNAQLLIEPENFRADTANSKSSPTLANSSENQHSARHSLDYKGSPTEVQAAALLLGNGHVGALAQFNLPASLANLEPCFKQLKAAGFAAVVLDKLNTQPQLAEALSDCAASAKKFGLITAAAIEREEELEAALPHVDMLFIKGKQMFNQPLLARAGKVHLPVILERNTMAEINELLSCADLILEQGNQQLILCESGVSSVKSSSPVTLDLAGVVELKARSHLPVLVNPCYAATTDLLPRQAKAIRNLGADGLIITMLADSVLGNNKGHYSDSLREFFL